jgi:hypothetical protein
VAFSSGFAPKHCLQDSVTTYSRPEPRRLIALFKCMRKLTEKLISGFGGNTLDSACNANLAERERLDYAMHLASIAIDFVEESEQRYSIFPSSPLHRSSVLYGNGEVSFLQVWYGIRTEVCACLVANLQKRGRIDGELLQQAPLRLR